MKYVIDIDEKYVNQVRSEKIDYMTAHMINLAVDCATPLDSLIEKIETEIEEERKDENIPYDLYPYSYKEGLDKAMSIINKHVKTESEEGK